MENPRVGVIDKRVATDPLVRPPRRRENQIEKTLVFSSITPQTISLNSHPRCQRIPGRIPKLQQEFRSKSSRSAGSTPRARILFMFCFFLFLRFVPIILAVLVVVGTSPVGKCGFFLVGTESADGSPYFPSFILYTGNIPPMHRWKKQES